MYRSFRLVLLLLASVAGVSANNLQITSVTITGQNTTSDHTMVKFTISWENSWRDPLNHDAAWVFIKYRVGPTGWAHATLSASSGDHTAPSGATITPTSDGKGVFIYRNASGSGNVSYIDVLLRWEYGADGVGDNDLVTVKVFGIEMVYVPQGSFHAGDGTVTDVNAQFSDATSTEPFLVTSEGAITLGGGGSGSLGNRNYTGGGADDYNDATSQTLPAAFPKGYAAFYSMKHEASEGMWIGFFNTLTNTQKISRDVTGSAGKNSDSEVDRNSIAWTSGDATTSYPDRAMSYVDGTDMGAFLDWAALRFMTELEYEKACRGDEPALPDEFPWGTTAATTSSVVRPGPEDGTDTMATEGANVYMNASSTTGGDENVVTAGPIRCGIFATPTASRVKAGASYYGILDLAGGQGEVTITTGNSTARLYVGTHGNGVLSTSGDEDISTWYPGSTVFSLRGGIFYYGLAYGRVSDRSSRANGFFRGKDFGIRGVRTAP